MSTKRKKTRQPSEQLIGLQMMNAVKKEVTRLHPWGFYKDESNFDLIDSDLWFPGREKHFEKQIDFITAKYCKNNNLDISNLSDKDKEDLSKEINNKMDLYNEFLLMGSEIAFAVNKGFKIKLNPDNVRVFSSASYDDWKDFVKSLDDKKEDCTADDIMNAIVENTNINELIEFIIDKGNILKDLENFGCTRYLVYSTKPSPGYHLNSDSTATRDTSTYIMVAVTVDGNSIYINNTNYNSVTDSVLMSGERLIINVENSKVIIKSSAWDSLDIKDLAVAMFSNTYVGILCILSSIAELIERETISKVASIEYKYTADHIPSFILRDGKIHYYKYAGHISHNEFYPEHRKSPRLHMVSDYYKSNGTHVAAYPRGTDTELMSYVQNVIKSSIEEGTGMAKTLTPTQLEEIAPIIEKALRKAKGKDRVKQVANKYKLDQGLVRHIAKTRKCGLDEYVPNETSIDIISNTDNREEDRVIIEFEEPEVTTTVSDDEDIIKTKEGYSYEEIAADYINGDMKVADILEKWNLSTGRLYKILEEYYGKDKIPTRPRHKRSKKDDVPVADIVTDSSSSVITDEKKEESMGRKNKNARGRGRSNSSKQSRNNHQIKKLENDLLTSINETVEEVVADVVEETVDNISFTFSGLDYYNENLVRIEKPDNVIEVGMVSDRHEMGSIPYMFEGPLTSEQIKSQEYQEEVINKYIDNNFEFNSEGNSTKAMVLYCTGIQPILASIIKVCLERHVNLTLKHWSPDDQGYCSQTMFNQFGNTDIVEWPFSKLEKKGEIFGYNCTLSDITNNSNLYCISLNKHEKHSDAFVDQDCKYIIFTSDDDIWKLYPEFVKVIKSSTSGEKNSVFLASFETTDVSFKWIDNISKSYNYK